MQHWLLFATVVQYRTVRYVTYHMQSRTEFQKMFQNCRAGAVNRSLMPHWNGESSLASAIADAYPP